jgi:hypothetical protein
MALLYRQTSRSADFLNLAREEVLTCYIAEMLQIVARCNLSKSNSRLPKGSILHWSTLKTGGGVEKVGGFETKAYDDSFWMMRD